MSLKKSIVIREANKTDEYAFADICMTIWGGKDINTIKEYFRKGVFLFKHGYSVAEIENKIVGSGEGFPIKRKLSIPDMNNMKDPVDLFNPEGSYYYIHGIEVLPKYRNFAIGSALLDYHLKVARKFNQKEICGIALSENIGFWKAHNFHTEGKWHNYKNYGLFIWIKRDL